MHKHGHKILPCYIPEDVAVDTSGVFRGSWVWLLQGVTLYWLGF